MAKVSVVLPIYNVEKYLPKCFDSVINQTLKDIEIIAVNDGATDNSSAVIEEYALKDNRIKIVNKENGGLASARNAGMKVATGDYIIFIDSDDWVELNCIEELYNTAIKKNADVVYYNHFIHTKDKIEENWLIDYLPKLENRNIDFKIKKYFLIYAWDKMFKLSFLKKHNLTFAEHIKRNEDGVFNFQLGAIKEAIWAVCPKSLYHYIDFRPGSITSISTVAIEEDIKAFKYITTLDEYKNITEERLISIIEKTIGGLEYHFSRKQNKKSRYLYAKQIGEFKKYLFDTVDNDILKKCENIDFIKRTTPLFYVLDRIFSIKKRLGKARVPHFAITVLGISFKTKIGKADIKDFNF